MLSTLVSWKEKLRMKLMVISKPKCYTGGFEWKLDRCSLGMIDVFDIRRQQGENIECKSLESSSFLHQAMVKVITVDQKRETRGKGEGK